jgi:hypothetical protein
MKKKKSATERHRQSTGDMVMVCTTAHVQVGLVLVAAGAIINLEWSEGATLAVCFRAAQEHTTRPMHVAARRYIQASVHHHTSTARPELSALTHIRVRIGPSSAAPALPPKLSRVSPQHWTRL